MSVSTPRAVVTATPVVACAVFLIGIGPVGCSSFDPEDETCEDFPGLSSTCDPSAGGGNGDDPEMETGTIMPAEWQCLVAEDVVPPRPATPGRVTYIFPVVDFDSDPLQPVPLLVPGVELTVCTNAACTVPAGPPDVIIQQDQMRPFVWAINMPYGLGAFSIRAQADGYVNTDYYVGGPMVGTPEGTTTVVALPLPMPKVSSVDNLLSNIGLPPLGPTSAVGILALRTLNCNRPQSLVPGTNQGARAEGVRVELVTNDPNLEPVPWVLTTGNQASRDLDATDGRGVAGFANLSPRNYTVRGIAPAPVDSEMGTEIGAKPASATVRANTITLVEVREGIDVWGQ
jgi:hypothetical protein